MGWPRRGTRGSSTFETARSGWIAPGDLVDLRIVSVALQVDQLLGCLVCGSDDDGADEAAIIERKQWDKCSPAVGDRLVTT